MILDKLVKINNAIGNFANENPLAFAMIILFIGVIVGWLYAEFRYV